MLPVIIWSPLEQFSGFISNDCPKCRIDGKCSQLVHSDWTDGHSSDTRPRLLYCVNSNVILVSRIYSCPNEHRVLGHHADIVHRFTVAGKISMLLFRLWHVAGFTVNFMDYVDHACATGTPMLQTERMIACNRARHFYALKQKYQQLQSSSSLLPFPEFDDDAFSFWKMSPKRHAISSCFLLYFWQWERTYHACLSQTSLCPGQSWLSCDHTFKSVSNIGAVRQADMHWIKQYAGLFCVLNANGEVLSWKMAKSLPLRTYRRTGFNCESPIIALCEIISESQKLKAQRKHFVMAKDS